jgi:hypothetical protein
LGGKCFHDYVPTHFERLYTLFEFFVFLIPGLLLFAFLLNSNGSWRRNRGRDGKGKRETSAESPVLIFEFCYSTLEVRELSFTTITRVLCSDTISVSTSFFTIIC